MPKRVKERDFAVNALRVVEQAIGEHIDGSPLENSASKSKRSAGGRIGGPARAANLTSDQRRAIAVKAARARWAGTDRKKVKVVEERRIEHPTVPR